MDIKDQASLENLHDLVVVDPVPWWPMSNACYALATGLLVVIVLWFVLAAKAWLRNRYRREGIHELRILRSAASNSDGQLAERLPALVKRVALAGWPRDDVASLSGATWLSFLDRSGHSRSFSDGPGRWLCDLAYRPACDEEITPAQIDELLAVVESWIKHHDRSVVPPTKQ